MSQIKKASSVVAVSRQANVVIEPVCLDVATAALFISTSTHLVRQLMYARKLPSFMLGKKRCIATADLRAYIAAQAKAAA
jgi:hypothetical protein